jgi:hypothetical protein
VDKKRVGTVVAVIVSTAASAALLAYKKYSVGSIASFCVTFFLIGMAIAFSGNKKDKVQVDELSMRQDSRSFRLSWLVTLLMVALIGNLDFLGIYTFKLNTAIAIILTTMSLSFWIGRLVNRNKTDAL